MKYKKNKFINHEESILKERVQKLYLTPGDMRGVFLETTVEFYTLQRIED